MQDFSQSETKTLPSKETAIPHGSPRWVPRRGDLRLNRNVNLPGERQREGAVISLTIKLAIET